LWSVPSKKETALEWLQIIDGCQIDTGPSSKLITGKRNWFLVKFDRDELGMWHDEDGDRLLRLGETDLVSVDVARS